MMSWHAIKIIAFPFYPSLSFIYSLIIFDKKKKVIILYLLDQPAEAI